MTNKCTKKTTLVENTTANTNTMTGRLSNKVILISGAARGQGAYEAQLFSQEGAFVVLGDVDIDSCEAVAQEITSHGGNVDCGTLDVTKESDWANIVAKCKQKFGRIDGLVNNAGIYSRTPVVSTTKEEFQQILDVNLQGVFLGSKSVIPVMKDSGGGSIVNISSTAGLVGNMGSGAYGASKGGIRSLTKYTAIQHAKDNIRANSVHPGPIDTEMISDNLATPEGRASSLSRIPLGRIGTITDVAMCVLFLCADESSYITGSEIVIDGGLTAI